MPALRATRWLLALAFTVATSAWVAAAGRHPALPTDALLVQIARDRGLERSGEQSDADVAHIHGLLRAAVRLNPRNLEALMLLYELSTLRGDGTASAEWLARLIEVDGANESAFSLWLDLGPGASQTAEKRSAWLSDLAGKGRRGAAAAMIQVRLARLAIERIDFEEARRKLDAARSQDPHSLDVALATNDLAQAAAPPHERISAMLDLLALNPTDTSLAWSVGELLDDHGFCDEALGLYEQVAKVSEALGAPAQYRWPEWLRLSRNAQARGDTSRAGQYAQAAFLQRGEALEPAYYAGWLLEQVGDRANTAALRDELGRGFANINEQTTPRALAEAAWFYCRHDPKPARALELAESASSGAPNDPFVLRVLGWAQALNNRTEDAKATLTRLAKRDAYAAAKLAELLLADGSAEVAAAVLAEAPRPPAAGDERALLERAGYPALAADRDPRIAQALAGFDRRTVDFLFNPGRYVAVEIRVDDVSPAPGEPWWAEFSLTNQGPFTISLGPGWMLNPVLLVSMRLEGDQIRDFPNLFTVSLDQRRALGPGETISVRRVLDVGPPRRVSRQTPQALQRVAVWAILDPLRGADGAWKPSPTGIDVRQVMFNRAPATPGREYWHALLAAIAGDADGPRFRSLEVFAQLLGESQRVASQKLHYRPSAIPAERLAESLREALTMGDWELRVRALDALQAAGLDRAIMASARDCLRHDHWLVRLMALRLLARQGADFRDEATQIAASDDDEIVREIAQSYVAGWTLPPEAPAAIATSQAASAPAERGAGQPPP